jgi:pilus assembly protein Flp/PilA
MQELKRKMMQLVKDEEGATAVEYGIMVALIAVAIIIAVTSLGTGLAALFDEVAGNFPLVGGGGGETP